MKTLKVNQRYNDYSPRLIESINGKEVVILKDKDGKEYCELYVNDIFVVEDERAAVLKYVEPIENNDLTNEEDKNADENKDDENNDADLTNDDENNDDENKDADLTNEEENKDLENDDKEEKPKARKTTKK